MQFIDEATIRVEAGKGGQGCLSFRREKYIAKKRAEMGDAAGNTLDTAILDALGALAKDKGFELD